jgi:hypothetical protein
MFTRPVRRVSSTAIFARGSDDSRQVLVYAMNLVSDQDVAMVLPLPVPPGSPDDSVRFMDLSTYPRFFDDLETAFHSPKRQEGGRDVICMSGTAKNRLAVHEVGSFEASFVPTRDDFSRLDPRFRLDEAIWQELPAYHDWGFAVFKLQPMILLTQLHPMAFDFPRRDPGHIFFPTVHVHDGHVDSWARFDHFLYCQDVDETRLHRWYLAKYSHPEWRPSVGPIGQFVNPGRAQGIVRPDQTAYHVAMTGSYPNVDIVV